MKWNQYKKLPFFISKCSDKEPGPQGTFSSREQLSSDARLRSNRWTGHWLTKKILIMDTSSAQRFPGSFGRMCIKICIIFAPLIPFSTLLCPFCFRTMTFYLVERLLTTLQFILYVLYYLSGPCIHYIHTAKYSPKTYVVNIHMTSEFL